MKTMYGNSAIRMFREKDVLSRERVAHIIDKLPENEKTVLALYYDDELTMQEISQVLCITEPMVCEIHSQAMGNIKTRINNELSLHVVA